MDTIEKYSAANTAIFFPPIHLPLRLVDIELLSRKVKDACNLTMAMSKLAERRVLPSLMLQ